jgi:hypothetical protein
MTTRDTVEGWGCWWDPGIIPSVFGGVCGWLCVPTTTSPFSGPDPTTHLSASSLTPSRPTFPHQPQNSARPRQRVESERAEIASPKQNVSLLSFRLRPVSSCCCCESLSTYSYDQLALPIPVLTDPSYRTAAIHVCRSPLSQPAGLPAALTALDHRPPSNNPAPALHRPQSKRQLHKLIGHGQRHHRPGKRS